MKRKQFILVVISAGLTVLGFYFLDILALVSLVPLFYALALPGSGKIRFLLGYLWGLVFFSCLCYWLIYVTVAGFFILVFYLALYPAVFSVLLPDKARLSAPFYKASVWVLLEGLRSFLFTGFPWGHLGYPFYSRLSFIQIADIFGVYGVSFLVVLVNGAIFFIFSSYRMKRKVLNISAVLLALSVSFVYGRYRLSGLEQESKLNNVALVQVNADPHLKWNTDYYRDNLDRIKLLILIAGERGALAILPETVLPLAWGEDKAMMEEILSVVSEGGADILIGLPYLLEDKLYNSSILIDKSGFVSGFYFKNHLVPFGEYLPLRRALSFLAEIYPVGYYSAADSISIFEYKGFQFAVLICYESIFPYLAREAALKGAHFFINQSDEGWFKKSKEIYLHNQIAVFRAVENRRSLVRATNTGLSCCIDYKGAIVKQLEPFKAGVLIVDIPVYRGLSFYSRHGLLLLAIINSIFVLLFFVWSNKRG